jgi:hypothetical protein
MPVSAGDFVSSVLPKAPLNSGALPLWIAFSTVLGVFNTVQCFISPKLSKRVYSRKPQQGESAPLTIMTLIGWKLIRLMIGVHCIVTPLASRLFGTWTLLASVVRLYTAYHITNQG